MARRARRRGAGLAGQPIRVAQTQPCGCEVKY